MKSKAIVFLGQVYPQGAVRHLAYLGLAIARVVPSAEHYYFASVKDELDHGAWALASEGISEKSLIKANDFNELLNRIAQLLDRYETLIFHCGGGLRQLRAVIPLKRHFRNRLKLVVTTHSFRHGTWKRIPMSAMQCWLYGRYVSRVVFQCPYAARNFVGSSWLFKHGRACVIPLGCEDMPEISHGTPTSVVNLKIDSLLCDTTKFKFVYLAGFGRVKNHEWLLRAVAPELKKYEQVRLLLLGQIDADRHQEISVLLRELLIEDKVLIPGKVPRADIPWVLQHCNCAIIPSCSETFGHTFVEPMMAGIPVVGTRVGVGEYAIREYETGLNFSLGNYSSIRAAFGFMVRNPLLAKAMGQKAKRIAQELFTHSQVAKAHMRMYLELMQEN